MKKIFVSLLGLALLSAQSVAFADMAPHKDPFSDVKYSSTYGFEISSLADADILKGYADGTFRPNNLVNRAEFSKILVSAVFASETEATLKKHALLDLVDISATCGFKDVGCITWFSPYVNVAVEKKVIAGYPDKTFRPDKTINFAEAAKMVLVANGYSVTPGTGASWYKPYIDKLKELDDVPETVTSPSQLLTRAEMVSLIVSVSISKNGY